MLTHIYLGLGLLNVGFGLLNVDFALWRKKGELSLAWLAFVCLAAAGVAR